MRNTVAPVVLQRDSYACQWCDTFLHEGNWSIDHIIPLSKGGTNDLDNLQAMCRSCNSMKGTLVFAYEPEVTSMTVADMDDTQVIPAIDDTQVIDVRPLQTYLKR